jgi:hypothetical protein
MNDTIDDKFAITLPSGYLQSRAQFDMRGARLGVAPRRFFHDDGENGSSGLSTDTLYLGPADAPTLVVIASGTHGVEGYAGAACQLRFLDTYRARFARSEVAYLLVHAVNPWGYLHDRRVTPEGVDLNRNFIDFPIQEAAPSAYAAYHPLLVANFRPLPRGLANEIRLLSCALTPQSRRQLQAAITAGQYDCPDGLFYGGAAPTASRRAWEQIIRTYAGGRQRAVLLDIHTGLGTYGNGELISYLPSSAAGFRQMAGWFGVSLKSMASGDSVSAAVAGTLTAAFDRAIGAASYAIGLEFGTRSALAVLYAMRFDQWVHKHAGQSSAGEREKARRQMKNAFAPSDPQWCRRVVARFEQVMEQLAAGLLKGQ